LFDAAAFSMGVGRISAALAACIRHRDIADCGVVTPFDGRCGSPGGDPYLPYGSSVTQAANDRNHAKHAKIAKQLQSR